MSKNVSDQVVEILTQIGVKHIFGIPGDTIDSMMESLREQEAIDFIILRHEETGAFAASAQAKLTGELAVCVACQGPGAIHLLNGLYDAALDQVPVLAITGQIDSSLIGTHATQEINQIQLFDEVAIYNQEVRSAANLPEVLALACQNAISKRGVAHISIPSDVMRDKAVKWPKQTTVFNPGFDIEASPSELKKAASLLNDAKKVTILYGDGARKAGNELTRIADRLQAPLVHTTRSKDILDNHHPSYVGGIGLMGSKSGNYAINHCDVLLVVGSSFAFREFYPDDVPIIQIDHDPTRLGLRVPITHGITGDCAITLNDLMPLIKTKTETNFLKTSQEKHQKSLKSLLKQARSSKPGKAIHPQLLTEQIGQQADDNAIFCVGTGSVTIWANNFLHLNGKQRFLWSWNLASLGWALPAAIGCQLREPNRQVIVPVGDGGFEMLVGDFATVVKYNLPIIFIVYNNATYRFIELEEAGEGNPIFGTQFTNPDFAKLAEAYGALGLRLENSEDINSILTQAFNAHRPVIIDAIIDPNEMFIPPKITRKMAYAFAKSTIRSYFITP